VSVVTAAFGVIRSATHRPPKALPVYLGDGVWGRVWKVESIIPTPFCSPFRHPVWRWKMRHLRRDTLLLEAEVNPAFSKRMRELEDEAFLNGTGGA
jgi:hypothetical protein